MMRSLTRVCYRRRRRVLLCWVLLTVGLSVAGSALADQYRMDVSLPGTEADAASDLLAHGGFGERAGFTGQIVFADPGGVTDGPARADAERLLSAVSAEVPGVRIVSPYEPAGGAQVSPEGDVAFAEIDFGDIELAEATELAEEVRAVHEEVTPSSVLQVELGGDLFVEESEFSSEGFGMIAAVVILLVAFGSVLAMGLPILTALFGIACGFALVSIGTTSSTSPTSPRPRCR